MEKIDPIFSSAPPRPRAKTPVRHAKPVPRPKRRGNGYVDGVVPHIQSSHNLQSQALLPAFDHVHSILLAHTQAAHGLMLAMATALSLCMLIVLWNSPIGYAVAGVVVLSGLVIGLTSRFIFAGSCFALIAIAASALVPHVQFFQPDVMATYTFVLLGYGMIYLLCENKFAHHTTKDKITTPRGINNNPIFKRALVRKYQKRSHNGSTKT